MVKASTTATRVRSFLISNSSRVTRQRRTMKPAPPVIRTIPRLSYGHHCPVRSSRIFTRSNLPPAGFAGFVLEPGQALLGEARAPGAHRVDSYTLAAGDVGRALSRSGGQHNTRPKGESLLRLRRTEPTLQVFPLLVLYQDDRRCSWHAASTLRKRAEQALTSGEKGSGEPSPCGKAWSSAPAASLADADVHCSLLPVPCLERGCDQHEDGAMTFVLERRPGGQFRGRWSPLFDPR